MHWLWVIIIGFIAGAIAKWFVPGPRGFIVTTLLASLARLWPAGSTSTSAGRPDQSAGFIGAIVGAVIILAVYRAFFGGPT
jgi:uncharacterized membrane protein YeaQ/YmgE (transglycosylase-associated protein family)